MIELTREEREALRFVASNRAVNFQQMIDHSELGDRIPYYQQKRNFWWTIAEKLYVDEVPQ